jgi:hypothetical protein
MSDRVDETEHRRGKSQRKTKQGDSDERKYGGAP